MAVIATTRRFHCLMIDDNSMNLKIGKHRIESIRGVVCDCATSGQEGVAKYKLNHHECVVLDYQMPGMDGMQTAKEIFSFDRNSFILGFTSEENSTLIETWRSVGLHAVLPKKWDALEEAIRSRITSVVASNTETTSA